MEIRTLESESSLVVNIQGALDTSNARDLEEYLESKMGAGYRKFLLDCASLESISSGGIALLVRLNAKMKSEPGLVFVLTQINQEIERILSFFGLDKKLTIYQNTTEAKNYLSKIPGSRKRVQPHPEKPIPPLASIQTATVRRSPYQDRIRFYYKGNAPRVVEEKPKREEEPVSVLEPVSLPKVDSLPKIQSEDILQRLETRMEEIKTELLTSNSNLEDKIRIDLDKKFANLGTAPAAQDTKIEKLEPAADNLVEIMNCESCGTKLRVGKFGKYQCPNCQSEFIYKGKGSFSFIEKLT